MTDQTNPNPSLRSSASASSSPNFPTDPEQQLQAGNANAPQRIRRRNRLITSCLECRRRKLKCDKQSPCSNCTRFKRDCVFLAPALDPASQMKLTEIKEKMGSLERTLEQDVARKGSRSAAGSRYGLTGEPLAGLENAEDSEDDFHVPDEERDLEPTALATEDATYYEDADDELMDLGVRLGKMRITERIGGFVRPKLSEELVQMLRGLASRGVTPTSPPGVNFLDHGPDYIAPASSFLFGGTPEARRTSVVEYLPSRTASDKLILQYWEAVHPIIRIVHRPSFERHYAAFWAALSRGVEPPASFQALVLSTMLAAVMSMTEDAAVMEFGVAKIELIESFQKGTETALARANVLRTTKLETLQALISYLIPLCRGEVSRAHSALTGMAIRLAECMGLHRDGSNYGLSPIEIHVRRLCWYQLCYLDVRTCEATGPRPQIHREDFDTKYPLNVNDADLESPYPPKTDSEHWTDNTIARMRFEINEAHRLMWSERPRLETKQTTLTSLLSKIKSINNALEERYIPMFENGKTPLQAEAYHIFRVLTTRMYIMTLQRYTSSRNRKMPERLRSLIFGASCTSLEHAMVLETAPALQQWLWYAGAFQQWHSALLILSEWFAAPNLPDFEERIWRCIDFAFETPADLDRPSKAYLIISELRNRLNAYRDARKYRAPTNIERLMQSSQQSQDLGFSEQQINAPMAPSRMMGAVPEGDFNYSGMAVAEASTSTHPALTYSPPNIPVPYTRESSAGASDKSPSDFSDVNLDIDWNEWDRLFPPEFNASSLNFSEMDYGSSQFTQGL